MSSETTEKSVHNKLLKLISEIRIMIAVINNIHQWTPNISYECRDREDSNNTMKFSCKTKKDAGEGKNMSNFLNNLKMHL